MKSDYWNVDDEQVIEKTGKPLKHWEKVLDKYKAAEKKSTDSVEHLQNEHDVPRYWARTLTTRYLKAKSV
jgi:hypothetical protein